MPTPDDIRGSTTVVELLKLFPDGEAARLMSRLAWPCPHCGGAFHEPLTMVTLQENLEMAADIGMDATTSLDDAYAAALERHGRGAKTIVLPFARYQLPANVIRLDAEPLRFPQEAHV